MDGSFDMDTHRINQGGFKVKRFLFLAVLVFGVARSVIADEINMNMKNTVEPIIDQVLIGACHFKSVQEGFAWAHSAALIYKREPDEALLESCTTRYHNEYYARCYDWTWAKTEKSIGHPEKFGENLHLFYRATKDIDLKSHSCIPEDEIQFPAPTPVMQRAKIGVIYEIQ